MTNAYDALVAEITEYLDGRLKPGLDAERFARVFVEEADFTLEELHFEVRGMHSATGAPLAFSFDTPAALREAVEE